MRPFDNVPTDILMRCIASCHETAATYAKRRSNAAREACEYWSSRADMLTEIVMARSTPNLVMA